MIRILLVDGEPTVRQGLKIRLELAKDICVVGEAGDGNTALRMIRTLEPDVVVMGIELPLPDGIAVTRILRAEKSRTAILIHSIHDDAETRNRADAAGASAFVSKHEGAAALLLAIHEAVTRANIVVGKSNDSSQVMRKFYADYYAVVEHSRAHAAFCEHAYGRNFC